MTQVTERPLTRRVRPDIDEADMGTLPEEPCLYCHRPGGVYFIIDDSPFGKTTEQVVACDRCKNSWVAYTGAVSAR